MDRLIRNHYYYFRVLAENLNGLSEPLESCHPIVAKPTNICKLCFNYLKV